MSLNPDNWYLNSYTNNTWTDLVAEAAEVAAISLCNTSGSGVTVDIRLRDQSVSPEQQTVLLPPSVIGANESYTLDLRSMNVLASQAIQVRADAAGAEFIASGVVEA